MPRLDLIPDSNADSIPDARESVGRARHMPKRAGIIADTCTSALQRAREKGNERSNERKTKEQANEGQPGENNTGPRGDGWRPFLEASGLLHCLFNLLLDVPQPKHACVTLRAPAGPASLSLSLSLGSLLAWPSLAASVSLGGKSAGRGEEGACA
eukprot:2179946-Rhodomonas_salina.3